MTKPTEGPIMSEYPKPAIEWSEGAVDLDECPFWWNRCRCEACATCGYRKHTAIHGPVLGRPPGSKPYGHKFVPPTSAQDQHKEKL